MAHLSLSLLGGFQAVLDGQALLDFKSNKVRALLTYLSVEADRPHRRERLAGLLWPDQSDRSALGNLRFTLSSLRTALHDRTAEKPFLLITRDTLQFNRASDHWLDLAQLETQINGFFHPRATQSCTQPAEQPSRAALHQLEETIALYRGDLLAGFSVAGAGPFEEWVSLRREQAAQQVIAALGWLAGHYTQQGDHRQAQRIARQQIALEPWHEAAHQALMRTLALDGRQAAALHQFEQCCTILHDELGVTPSDETIDLYKAIKAGELTTALHPMDQAQPAPLRFSPPPVSTPSPVVGRELELARLSEHLVQAVAGEGGVIFVAGEAGSGKSVLLGEVARRALQAHPELLVAGGVCAAVNNIGDPYLPFREILHLLSGDSEATRSATVRGVEMTRSFWAAMPDVAHALVDHGPALIDTFVPGAALLLRVEASIGQAQHAPWFVRLRQIVQVRAASGDPSATPTEQTDIISQVAEVLHALSLRHPLLLLLDDLQWADPATASLLFHLGRRLTRSRILIAAAYRPEVIAAHTENTRHPLEVVVNELQRVSGRTPIDLDACDGRRFVAALSTTPPYALGAEFCELLVRHTEGHPLFTVELLRSLEERGALVRNAEGRLVEGRALHWEHAPARIEATIAEQVSRLPDHCQALLAAASVEGHQFTAEAIARALNLDERAVVHCLSSELVARRRLVTPVGAQRLGAQRASQYRFRHHLFQQYLYEHLDDVQRTLLHEAVGSALQDLFAATPEEMDRLAPRLAWHFEMAGSNELAASYHLHAGRHAASLTAYETAIRHLERGIALLEALPDSPTRTQLRMELHLTLVTPLSFVQGFWSTGRTQALERAYAIAQNPGLAGSDEQWLVLASAAYYAIWGAEPARSVQSLDMLLASANRSGNRQHLQWANSLLGFAYLTKAKLCEANDCLTRALDLYRSNDHLPAEPLPELIVGIQLSVLSLAWHAFVLWQLGYPTRAAQQLEAALKAAEANGYSTTLAITRAVAAMMLFLCARDRPAALQQLQALRQSTEINPTFNAWADSLTSPQAKATALDAQGLQNMRDGAALFAKVGSGLGRATQILLLAESTARAGQVEEGLRLAEEALAWMRSTGVRALEAEGLRLCGVILSMPQANGAVRLGEAEACFRSAIDVARRLSARWWELRATVSLCQLLITGSIPGDSRRAQAHALLAAAYEWFDEGFDTADLQEAHELLRQLSQE